MKTQITNTLKSFGVEIDSITSTEGPVVTLYEVVPTAGTKIAKIKALQGDIALSLCSTGVRIIAPIPGRGTVGIEVPNKERRAVSMSEIQVTRDTEIQIALGKTVTNETYLLDLAKAPHILVAGATGQGKSVALNVMILSLLQRKSVQLVLIDPKKVEFSQYERVAKVITEPSEACSVLESLCIEMDLRYNELKAARVRNIQELNKVRAVSPMRYVVCVIDEFADLMMSNKEVERSITRLAQLARAVGIHLIIATQRPSVSVITGVIKANFPTRIAFKVTSRADSQIVLDQQGAEQLIGQGDMLVSIGSDVTRVQSAYVSTQEVEAAVSQSRVRFTIDLPEVVTV